MADAAGLEVDGIECAADLPLPPRLREPGPEFGQLELPDGHHLRHARWRPQGPARGTVVLLPGRSEFIEKYDELAHDWLARGWQVFALDWRSQGLSSRFLEHRHKGHVPDFALLANDLGLYLERVVRPAQAGPLVLFGHSMGGHLTLRHLVEAPGCADAAILSAPMADIHFGPLPRGLARSITRMAVTAGYATRYAPGQGDYDPRQHIFAANPVTTDRARWAIFHMWFRANPALALGGVTYGWLDAAFRSMDPLARPEAGRNVTVPMLVLAAGRDVVVPPAAQRALGTLYPSCEVFDLPDAMHEVMAERDGIRRRAWAAMDGFLDRVLAAPAVSRASG